MDTFPPSSFNTRQSHMSSYQQGPPYGQQQFHLSAPFPSTSTFASSGIGGPSTQPSSSSSTALFSPSLFAPSPLTPSAGPGGGSYFSALSDSMGWSFGMLQQQQQQQQQHMFAAQQQQQQESARLTALDDESSFWSTSPPPPQQQQRTASLHEFETASAGGHESASSSSFSVSTPAASDEDGAFDDLKAVDASERGSLIDPPSTASLLAPEDRAESEHSDAALRSADGKGTTIAEVLEEMGITRKSYDRMTPAKKRQIRNKVSARAFRARKKSLVENLEATIVDKDHLIENLRKQILKLQQSNSKLETRLGTKAH